MPETLATINFVDAEELAQELSDEIVKRLACNELSEEAARIVRKVPGCTCTAHVVYAGQDLLTMDSRTSADGSLHLTLKDTYGNPAWSTTLRPPAKPPVPPQFGKVRALVDEIDDLLDEIDER